MNCRKCDGPLKYAMGQVCETCLYPEVIVNSDAKVGQSRKRAPGEKRKRAYKRKKREVVGGTKVR